MKMKKILSILTAASILFLSGCTRMIETENDSVERQKLCLNYGGIPRVDYNYAKPKYAGCDFIPSDRFEQPEGPEVSVLQ